MIKRIISLLLGAICVCACFCSCKEKPVVVEPRDKYKYTQGLHDLTAPETDEYMAKSGKSDYKILMPSKSDSNLTVAESELKYFFEEATGVKLETVVEPESGLTHTENGKYISLGSTQMLASSNVDLKEKSLGTQGVRIVTKDKTVYVTGSTTVGTLNAVYTLLNILFDYEQFSYDNSSIRTHLAFVLLLMLYEPDFS